MSSPSLSITTGSNDARRLAPGEAVPSEEAISMDEITRRVATVAESANGLITEVRQVIPALAGDARTFLANLNRITGPRNQRQIEGILAEFNTLLGRESPKIAQITDQISALAKHADSAVGSVGPLVSNIDRTVTNVNNTVDAIRGPLTKDLAELERTLHAAQALLSSVQNVVHANEGDITETMRNLRSTSENVRALSESLKQRPWNLIRTTQPADRRVPK
jgi:ABC-type transporter Mla subunit MlaD